MIKIALFKAAHGGFIDRFISFFTLSKYSHCEIVFSDGVSASASSEDGWFEYNKNDGYDYLGAGGSIFRIDFSSEDKKYCSYSCSLVLGLTPVNSPAALFKKLIKLGFINTINN